MPVMSRATASLRSTGGAGRRSGSTSPPPLPKRTAKRRRKDKLNKQTDAAAYQASLTSPWAIYVKGGPTK